MRAWEGDRLTDAESHGKRTRNAVVPIAIRVDRVDEFSAIYVVGGGAELLKEELSETNGITIVNEPHLMNARGFLIVAESIAKNYIKV